MHRTPTTQNRGHVAETNFQWQEPMSKQHALSTESRSREAYSRHEIPPPPPYAKVHFFNNNHLDLVVYKGTSTNMLSILFQTGKDDSPSVLHTQVRPTSRTSMVPRPGYHDDTVAKVQCKFKHAQFFSPQKVRDVVSFRCVIFSLERV